VTRLVEVGKSIEVDAEIVPVFTRWRVTCRRCGAIFYVDTEPNSASEDILKLEETHCGLHPSESAVIELV